MTEASLADSVHDNPAQEVRQIASHPLHAGRPILFYMLYWHK